MEDRISQLHDYSRQLSEPVEGLLEELERETHLKTIYPQMISGPLQGRFLEMISRMIRPERILEIGTFTGYSAICLAKGLSPTGVLHTIDINDELRSMASGFFERAGLAHRIVMHTGDALLIIPELEEEFDLVFIDGAKHQYPDYYREVFEKVRPGGFIIADNVWWNGKVMDEGNLSDKETRGIAAFNRIVFDDSRADQLILPLRDGLSLIRKRKDPENAELFKRAFV